MPVSKSHQSIRFFLHVCMSEIKCLIKNCLKIVYLCAYFFSKYFRLAKLHFL